MTDTIFAVSSGAPPAAIAVMRISGPKAGDVLKSLAGALPEPRRASFRTLTSTANVVLDQALVLWFPGPNTATGEHLAEFHLHGGRAVVTAVEVAISGIDGLRRAEAGEFTRRAFANGRIDLAEAEGLADLLSAETELQRRSAIAMAGGAFSRQVESWRDRVLTASASVEAVLDFGDEDDVSDLPHDFLSTIDGLIGELEEWLARPRAEMLKDGFRVVLAGPPNAGKSTLFNALVEDEAAITAPLAGTTRDVLTRAVAIDGIPFVFVDTAGLRSGTDDMIEAIGIERARGAVDDADLVLWLGGEKWDHQTTRTWAIAAQSDRREIPPHENSRHRVSAISGEGMSDLRQDLVQTARSAMPRPGTAALNHRQRSLIAQACKALDDMRMVTDPLLVAECLRRSRLAFDTLVGRSTTEHMLDALFGQFCIGK